MHRQLLAPLPGRELKLRVSLYADDAVIFAKPIQQEIDALLDILRSFGESMGLHINPAKSSALSIRCDNVDLEVVL